MIIKKRFQIIMTLVLFFGILLVGQTLGLWQLKGHEIGGETLIIEVSNKYGIPLETIYETWNIPEHVSPRAELSYAKDEAGFSIGRFRIWVTAFVKESEIFPMDALSGLVSTDTIDDELNITGATTIQELSDMFSIPLEDIYQKFSLPTSLPADTKLRELREDYGIELGEIKLWIQIKTN